MGQLLANPRAERERCCLHALDERAGGHPLKGIHLVGGELDARAGRDPGDEHGAHLPLDHTGGIRRTVLEIGEDALDAHEICGAHAQLLGTAAHERLLGGLPRSRVAAHGVRPHAGEGELGQRPPGDQHAAVRIDDVAAKSEVQGGVVRVHRGLIGDATGGLGFVEKHNLLGSCLVSRHGIYTTWPVIPRFDAVLWNNETMPAPLDAHPIFRARTDESARIVAREASSFSVRLDEYNSDNSDYGGRTAEIANTGTHLRSLLVHLGADRPEDTAADAAAGDAIVGATFDLVHTGLCIIDDVIDADHSRRGLKTIHATAAGIASPTIGTHAAIHYGNSIAILIGMNAVNDATALIAQAPIDPDTARTIISILAGAVDDAVIGEFMDVEHSIPGHTPTPRQVDNAAVLKTSPYSFEAPLVCGGLLAGRPAHDIDTLRVIARHVGAAFRMADDLRALTSNAVVGDIRNHRTTPLMVLAESYPTWPAIHLALSSMEMDTARALLEDSGILEEAREIGHAQLRAATDKVHGSHMFSAAAEVTFDYLFSRLEEIMTASAN